MTPLEPDCNQLEIFIEGLFRHCGRDGSISLRAFYEGDGSKSFRISNISLKGGLRFLIEAAEDDARRAAQHPKPIVFCPPVAVFHPAANGRAREQDIFEAPALSVELDQNPRAALEVLERLLGPATLVIRSGGFWTDPTTGEFEDKLHAHWRLKEPARGADIVKLKQARRLATAIVGGDPTNVPACHPIRWPGSWHKKAEPRLCEIIGSDHLDNELDLAAALTALEASAPKGKSESQKGRDWQQGPLDLDKAFADIITGNSFHPALTPLAASFAVRGVPEALAVQVLQSLLTNTQTTDPTRVTRRDTELGKLKDTVRSGYEKFRKPSAAPTGAQLFNPWERFVAPAFPIDILSPVLREFVLSQSNVIGGCPSAMAMATLAVVGGAASHRFSLKMMEHGQWYEHPRLWVLLVGDPSQKKTPEIDAATAPLERLQAERFRDYKEALRQYEQAGNENDPEPEPPPRYVVVDTTVQKLGEILTRADRGLLVKRDELTGWIGEMDRFNKATRSTSDRAFWLQSWNGGPYHVDRIGRGENFIENLSVSVLGGIQPDRLAELEGLTSDGLLQRFLPVMMRESSFTLDAPTNINQYWALIRQLLDMPPQRLSMTDDARSKITTLRRHLHDLEKASGGVVRGFQSFIGKLAGYSGRLALVLHLSEFPDSRFIGGKIAENVHRLVLDFLIPHGFEFYSLGETGDQLKRLASYILTCDKDRILASDLTANIRDFRGLTLFQVKERTSPLVAGGWLDPVDHTPMCKAWWINPIIKTRFSEQERKEAERKRAIIEMLSARRIAST